MDGLSIGEILTTYHDDFVRTLWALAQLQSATNTLPDDEIEMKVVIRTAFNQMAQIVRLADTAIPELRAQTLALKESFHARDS